MGTLSHGIRRSRFGGCRYHLDPVSVFVRVLRPPMYQRTRESLHQLRRCWVGPLSYLSVEVSFLTCSNRAAVHTSLSDEQKRHPFRAFCYTPGAVLLVWAPWSKRGDHG